MLDRFLKFIEVTGNRLPDPCLLFIWLSLFIVLLSGFLSIINIQAIHPITQETYTVTSLLNSAGLQKILSEMVNNFVTFAPVGVVLVIVLGIGLAEHSGLVKCVLQKLVKRSSDQALSYIVAFAGVLSSIGFDVGYVALTPIAAMLYQALGRSPLAGIAVAFASVSAGYSANLFIGPVDVLLSAISTEAATLADASSEVTATDNYYFIIVSTFLITLVCGWLSNRLIEPRLALSKAIPPTKNVDELDSKPESLKAVAWFSLLYLMTVLFLTLPEKGALANDANGNSVLLKNLVPLLAIYFGLAGYIFGRSNKHYTSGSDAIKGMQQGMQTMAYYLVLMFFAAQFVNYFAWTNIGIITAINGANWLGSLNLPSTALLVGVIFLAATVNLFVGSASAKWTLLAPVFIPMLMLLSIPPEQTQMAFRIGDSATNIITPLMPYFGIVLAFAQRYQKDIGLGSIISMMLPYSVALLISWTVLITVWLSLGLPLGP